MKNSKNKNKIKGKHYSSIKTPKIWLSLKISMTSTSVTHNKYINHNPQVSHTEESSHVDVIFYYLQKKSKRKSHSKYRFATTNYFFKTYIDNFIVVPDYENKVVSIIKGTLNSAGFFEQKDKTNWSVIESYQGKNKSHPFEVKYVTSIAQQASNNCGLFVVAYAEFLSDGLQVPPSGIIFQPLRMRYVSLLWNYVTLKAHSGYFSINEDPHRPRLEKPKFISPDENLMITTID
ncbi:hypothetical protein R3W88_024274 [Solanum pinnatisectum]|uniref:Ubiquitin-like protease family profile domain-containing protein n=1 Tax=Solanum pinnatisectum TaxID=50273 RepID=A0AAV9M046_9SOLN|nr:hypothetical protein R3W88_024274 [Solanum pinnatisectum]